MKSLALGKINHLPCLRKRLLGGELTPTQIEQEARRQQRLVETVRWVNGSIRRGKEPNPQELLELHRRLTGLTVGYRIKPATIRTQRGRKMESFPSATAVPELMKAFFSWRDRMRNSDPLLKAAGSHLVLLSIHPFADGNGRTSRMIEYWDLRLAKHPAAEVIHPEVVVHWNLKAYFGSLRTSRRENSILPFVRYMRENYLLFSKAPL